MTTGTLSSIAGGTVGTVLSNKTLQSPNEQFLALSTAAGDTTKSLDLSLNTTFEVTLNNTASCTFTFTNVPAGVFQNVVVILIQGAGGNKLATFSSASYTDGVAPVLATTAGKRDVLGFFTTNGGTLWVGAHSHANV